MNILREQRKKHNKTQEQISKLLDISQVAYSKYENDKAKPNKEVLKKLADFYDVSVDYLVGRTPDEKYVSYDTARMSRLGEIYESLPQKMRDQLISYADFLSAQNEKEKQKNHTEEDAG